MGSYFEKPITCPVCDEFEAETYKGYTNHYKAKHDGHALVALVGEDTLVELYENMAEYRVADELGVSRQAVKYALRHIGVERRDESDANELRYENMTEDERKELVKSANRAAQKLPRLTLTQGGYLQVRHIGERFKLHRLVAVADYGFDAVADNHVHHKNNIPWDNRPSNLVVMGVEEHHRHHSKERERDDLGRYS
jgi:predicted transcriptional regulator